MNATEVHAFFERVATDWDTMRLDYYGDSEVGKIVHPQHGASWGVAGEIKARLPD